MNSKISYAVAAILGGTSLAAHAAPSTGEGTDVSTATPTEGLTEVIVTAQRRSENIQNVPISVQALTAETLKQLNISTFDDYVRFLPNVTAASNGPGQNEIFIRGVSAGSQASQGSGSTGIWPNVAIYLDNQSGQLPNRNLDIYAVDLERIEVLAGPQGTLFGAGAQAGVIRYITNQPKLNVVEANFTAGYGTTAHGDNNSAVTAVLNVPLIEDKMAVRGVIFSDTRGGYINNVPATFTRKNTDLGISSAGLTANAAGQCPDGLPNNGYCVPPGSPSLNNYNLSANAINPVTYQGIRAELLYKFNDDWDVLISQMYQDMNSHGVFYDQPNASDGAPLQPLEVTLFNNAYNKDRFSNTAWTFNGKIGDLKFIYTGGYLTRHVDQIGDYTNYARGLYADYYQCYGPVQGQTPTCYSPSAVWRSQEQNQHQQHEIRLSTPDEWRLRAIAGAFWEDNKLYDQTAWLYKHIPPCTTTLTSGCMSNVGTFPGSTVKYPGVQNDNTSFYQDQVRDTKQTAFFASVDFDLIPKTLTITGGTRYFRFENSMKGSVLSSFNCMAAVPVSPTGCHPTYPDIFPWYSYNLDAQNLSDTESGFRSRANLTWHVTPDVMVYYTFSQGFRPGGFNQNGGTAHAASAPLGTPGLYYQYFTPRSYQSDDLTNNEIGWKTEFLDHRLQWNGAIYRETWKNVQVAFFDTGVTGNVFFNTNGQDFLIKGLEQSLIWRVTNGLTLQGTAAWNHSEQTNSPALIDNNSGQLASIGVPASPNVGKPITLACNPLAVTINDCVQPTNPFGAQGSPAANAPPIQFSVRARYDWNVGGYLPFVQFGASHTGHSFTQAGANPLITPGGALSTSRGRFENPAYTTYEASVGVSKDAWYFNLYCENLSNSSASVFVSTDQFIVAQTPLRPRVIGGTFGYSFSSR
jgi:outer membrane receptor protein involved in Fe transport